MKESCNLDRKCFCAALEGRLFYVHVHVYSCNREVAAFIKEAVYNNNDYHLQLELLHVHVSGRICYSNNRSRCSCSYTAWLAW